MGYFWSLLDKHASESSAAFELSDGLDAGKTPKKMRRTAYFTAMAPTMDSKILNPSMPPNSGSLERSGCGIIPSTFRPGLQIPTMLSSDPLGLASGVISPVGEQ